ncbi:BON domain-containing protein [Tautonia plasticadhaerens]|uniref:BON domain protein n=1 Tax=Tautonia plasticadhaerens TaxID=2527974 RepID=A0A518H0D9_9BACT|nr:BON domain-containing protein [Tautonia plasticadhaerens]QDV34281.1 BON domain protein [Tautonia plasticadhaerens]
MTRTRYPRIPGGWLAVVVVVAMAVPGPSPAGGQLAPRPGVSAPSRPGPADLLRAALASNPVTAPYPIEVVDRGGRAALRGVVGTKVIYDAAIRTAIASGVPFADELVIDTLAAQDVALRGAAAMAEAVPPGFAPPMPGPSYGAVGGYPPPTYMPFGPVPGGAPGLIYPPPLFGFADEPFFGLEPPVISYPPYWGALSARRLAEYRANGPAPAPFPAAGGELPPPGLVDVELDPDGVATIRGLVPTLADRVAVGQQLAQTPGITQVINLLVVEAEATSSAPADAAPPEPPAPGLFIDPRPVPPARPGPGPVPGPEGGAGPGGPAPPEADAPAPAEASPPGDLPELAGLPIRVTLRDGTATLSGDAPSAAAAMAAYLAVKRHPGVDRVVDRLRFSVPVEPGENPLRSAADLRDVEEYLGDQVRRQLDGLAEVDRVRLLGDRLEIRGRLLDPAGLRRAEATLRSTPVLRGFTIAPELVPGG